MAAEISFKPWVIQSPRSVSRLIRKSCGSVVVTTKPDVTFDGFRRGKELASLVDMCTEKKTKQPFLPGVRQLVRRFRDQAAIPIGSGKGRSGSARSWRQASSSPLHRAASNAANANTPWG